MKNRFSIFLICAVFITNTVPRWLVNTNDPDDPINKLYYIGDALSFLLCSILIYFLIRDKVVRLFSGLLLIWASSNIIDELFFDPIKVEWNEILFCAVSLLYIINSLFRKQK